MEAKLSQGGYDALREMESPSQCLRHLLEGGACRVKMVMPVVPGSKDESVLIWYGNPEGLYSFSKHFIELI